MNIPLLPDIVAIFCLSIGVLLVCHKIKVPPIVGFLLTGVLCGPSALGLVENLHAVELLAEIGVVLLLFTIGMELSTEELTRLQKPIFIGGTVQVVLVMVFFTLLAVALGNNFAEGIIYGCLAALSSTAIVLSRLQHEAQTEAPHGRLSLSVLIFQDLAIVPMMLAVPFLAGKVEAQLGALIYSGSRTIVILGGAWALAYYIVPKLMNQVMRTRSRELLLMTTLGLCFAVAMGTAYLGLSLALGAFLAGLLLAGSEYSLKAVEGVLPFKDVFTSLFFISVGMLLDLNFFLANVDSVLFFAALLVIAKSILAIPAFLILKYPLRIAIISSLSLAQVGEFSFVLARSGVDHGLIDQHGYQTFLAASILTMMLTPALMSKAPGFAVKICRLLRIKPEEPEVQSDSKLQDHLIIVGFGVGGKYLARTAKQLNIPYIILEMNPDTVKRFKATEPIHHGDASSPLVLKHFGIDVARALTVVISDPAAVRGITRNARDLNKKIHIVVRTRFLGEVQALKKLGANDVIPEDFETAIEIFSKVLGYYMVPRQTIESFVQTIRCENYDMTRQMGIHGTQLSRLADEIFTGLEVVTCKIEPGSVLAGKRLMDLTLRKDYNVTIVGIKREQEIIPTPDGNSNLEVHDLVFVFATPADLAAAIHLFSAAEEFC